MVDVSRVYFPNAAQKAARWKLLHLTVHPVRGWDSNDVSAVRIRHLVLLLMGLVWLLFYPSREQLRAVTVAVVYSFVESTFTTLERGRQYTSLAQFVANLMYAPVLLTAYGSLFLCVSFSFSFLFVLCKHSLHCTALHITSMHVRVVLPIQSLSLLI